MSYVQQKWDTSSYINPTRMNHIEEGIKSNSDDVDELMKEPKGSVLKEQLDVLQARVDTIIPEGTPTEGNAELIDIRVGADGTVYQSAGNAVREQITKVNNDITTINTNIDNINNDITEISGNVSGISKDVDFNRKLIIALIGDIYDEQDITNYATEVNYPANALPFAELQMLGGASEKWNQQNNNNCQTRTSNGITFEKNGNTWRIYGQNTGTNTFANIRYVSTENFYISGHKYLFSSGNDRAKMFGYMGTSTLFGVYESSKQIATAPQRTSNGDIIRLRIENTDTTAIDVTVTPICVDLTAIFGSGNEPTSVDDDRIKWIESYASEHPNYDEGSIIDAKVEQIVSRGKNLLAELKQGMMTFAVGSIPYIAISNANWFVSSDFIKVKPNTSYVISMNNSKSNMVGFCDKNKVLIGSDRWTNRTAFVTPNDCQYIIVRFTSGDASVNLSVSDVLSYNTMIEEGTNATNYSPYKAPIVKPIPTSIQSLPDYGIGINAELYNYIDWKEMKYHHRVGVVDLGSLGWDRYNFSGTWVFYAQITDMRQLGYSLQSKYIDTHASVAPTNLLDKQLSTNSNRNYIYVRDDSFEDATAFKTALNGVLLYYELATEGIIDVSDMIPEDFEIIEGEGGGTILFDYPEKAYKIGVPSTIEFQLKM